MASEFIQWLAGLEREFAFLLALPFVVAVVGLWSWWSDKDKEGIDREYEVRSAQAAEGERRDRERRQGERRARPGPRIAA